MRRKRLNSLILKSFLFVSTGHQLAVCKITYVFPLAAVTDLLFELIFGALCVLHDVEEGPGEAQDVPDRVPGLRRRDHPLRTRQEPRNLPNFSPDHFFTVSSCFLLFVVIGNLMV